jgi:hypothetical protein
MSALRTFLKRTLSDGQKERIKRPLRAWARATAAWRSLPDFVIIGAQKCGTSSLFYYIQQHPCVGFAPAITKEVHYFDEHFAEGEKWYRSHFPLRSYKGVQSALKGRFLTGEASPEYLYHPDPPERIRALLPGAKFIALLRNPTDRAFSHYQLQRKRNRDDRTFEEAALTELETLERERESGPFRSARATWEDLELSYLRRGLYLEQLNVWTSLFPREQILVLRSEDLFGRAEQTYARTLEFLGLPSWRPSEFENIAPGGYRPLEESLRTRLDAFFEPHNRALAEAFGEEFLWSDVVNAPGAEAASAA